MTKTTLCHATFMNMGCEIHYWHREGEKDKHILFFHGAGLDHHMFDAQLEAFDDSYSLTLWDARGHGLSKLPENKRFEFDHMISDCQKLYETLGIDKAILIGQSMGGNLAQAVCYRHPEMVEKMVLIDCSKNTEKLSLGEKLMLKLAKPMLICYPSELFINQSAEICSNREDVRKYVRDCLRKMGKSAFIDAFMALVSCLKEDAEYRFPCPVLLLCGSDDKSGNIRKIAAPWAASDDNCTLHMIENARHNSNQDQPETVNRHILDFIGRKAEDHER